MKLQWLKDIIGNAYTDEMDASAAQALGKDFVPRSDFNDKNAKVKELETQITQLNDTVKERDKQLETLKASTGDVNALKEQITKLQGENADAAKSFAAEIKKLKIDTAVDMALSAARARNPKAVKALLELDNAELDDKGLVKGLDEQIKKLTAAPDSAFMFETKQQGNFEGFKPGEKGGNPDGGMTLENFRKLSPADRFKFAQTKPEEYKKLYGGTE